MKFPSSFQAIGAALALLLPAGCADKTNHKDVNDMIACEDTMLHDARSESDEELALVHEIFIKFEQGEISKRVARALLKERAILLAENSQHQLEISDSERRKFQNIEHQKKIEIGMKIILEVECYRKLVEEVMWDYH